MTMVKVVQFLEIGNLPKSQLNACPYRKVMIKNLFLSISKSGSARNFHTIFEFSLQISRSHGPPVFRLSQSWGAWPPARSKKTSKTSSSARARWNLALLKLLIFIEFRLQLRHPQSFSCPIWQILQPQICSFSLKHECFRELIVNEFILQFTTPLSFGCPIWEIL